MEKEYEYAYYHAEGSFIDIQTVVDYHKDIEKTLKLISIAIQEQNELWNTLLETDAGKMKKKT